MAERDRLVDAMTQNFDNALALFGSLSEADFGVQSLCPDWTARGVLVHLAAVESMLAGWLPSSVEEPVPFDRAGAYIAGAESMSNQELLASFEAILDQRRDELAALTDDDVARPSMTPVGPQTYGRFLAIRCFDFWVHERDVRMPLARPADDGGLTAEMALREVQLSLGYIVGKKVGLPDGSSITFHLTGPLQRDLHVAVDGRAAVVGSLDDPTVELTCHSTSFIMLACGRIDPQNEIDEGRVSWSGDAELGERAARNLAFTM